MHGVYSGFKQLPYTMTLERMCSTSSINIRVRGLKLSENDLLVDKVQGCSSTHPSTARREFSPRDASVGTHSSIPTANDDL